jgi:UDP-N-acetylmuramate--alanine ligase
VPQARHQRRRRRRGGWFAVEACEYDRSFLNLSPHGAIVTNVEADHLDYFGDIEAIKSAFCALRRPRSARRTARHRRATCRVRSSRPRVARCGACRRELRVRLRGERNGYFTFDLTGPDFRIENVTLGDPRRSSTSTTRPVRSASRSASPRASGASTPTRPPTRGARAAAYEGSLRRFERWGTVGGLAGGSRLRAPPDRGARDARDGAARVPRPPLHVLFQPHQHSRTARFLAEFVDSLRMADRVVVADVYGARAHIDGEQTAGAKELVERLRAAGVDAVEGGVGADAAHALGVAMEKDSAVLVLGAGDIVDFKDAVHRRAGP